MANPAEDLIAHSLAFHPLLYRGGAIEHSAEKTAQYHTAADIHAPASQNGDGYPPSGSPSSLKLRRDKAIGVMRQRNRKAGGTPGGRNQPPCNKKSVNV